MRPELSVILILHDAEPYLASLVKRLALVASRAVAEAASTRELGQEFEILALDERSRDNTLAVLSLLEPRVPELQAFQDVPRGTSIMRASRLASGRAWLFIEGDVDEALVAWALAAVLGGRGAAMVGQRVLAVESELARSSLAWVRGDLSDAQREIKKVLSRRGQKALRHQEQGLAPLSLAGLRARLSPKRLRRRILGLFSRARPGTSPDSV